MEQIPPPSSLILSGNVDMNWKRFKQRFQLYLQAIGGDDKSDSQKIAMLLTVAGSSAIEVYNTFTFTEEEAGKYDIVIKKFDDYCSPMKNETYERYVFRCRLQKEGESFEQFLTDIRLKCKSCNFGDISDSLIRDQIVIGILDFKVKERLLRETDLTLAKAIKICQAVETAQAQMKTFEKHDDDHDATGQTVHAVNRQNKNNRQWSKKNDKQNYKSEKHGPKSTSQQKYVKLCKRCGSTHGPNDCPAIGKTCFKCNGKNHYSHMCFTKPSYAKTRGIHAVEADTIQFSDPEEFFVGSIESPGTKTEWITPLEVMNTLIPFKLDTGAQVNILPEQSYNSLQRKPHLYPTSVILTSYSGSNIPCKGTCNIPVNYKGKSTRIQFVVVTGNTQPILGVNTCENLGLVKRIHVINTDENNNTGIFGVNPKDNIMKQYHSVFNGIGCMKKPYHIQLKDDAVPVIHPARKFPFAKRDKLKKELDRTTSLGLTSKVDEPTDWVNSMVAAEKSNNELRICLDPKDLNSNIKREHYRVITRDEIISEMSGAKYFTKLDATSGFWQIPLDEESANLTTFNTPFGRYRFNRLPFGICSATEVFHKRVEQEITDSIEGCKGQHDDIIVWGSTVQEHDERLQKVLERAKIAGLTFNPKKCVFRVQKLVFLGETLTPEGVQPDPNKVKAIFEMPDPTCKEDIQRMLGVANFVGKFIPNLSASTLALRSLLRNDTEWNWDDQHKREWENLKTVLTKEPVLKYFDSSKPTKISTDASKCGIGATLLQKHDDSWLPVAYASRAMTPAETRYAQIEKEMLGIAYGCNKFHEYVYGMSFIAETDHKPLIAISKKDLNDTPPRIQRLLLKLQKYDITFEFTPGKLLVLADTLSRAYAPTITDDDSCEKIDQEVESHVDGIKAAIPISEEKWKQIAAETVNDKILFTVMQQIKQNTPHSNIVKPYRSFVDELSVIDGVLMKGDRVIIPSSMRAEMISRIHEGHLGIEKSKSRAREVLYWPSLNTDIANAIQSCDACQTYQYKQPKEPMIPHPKPSGPWEKVGTDLFQLKGKDYLLVIDYYSNYPEIALLSNTSTSTIISHMKSMFARHGLPQVLVSDNAAIYTSQEFQEFAKSYEFKHITSSPYFAQSNGKSEVGVKIVKRLLKKAVREGSDPYLALLNYRDTPLQCGLSPAQLLMGRKLRTRLTIINKSLKADDKQQEKLFQTQKSQKNTYDVGAKPLPPLKKGDVVRMHTNDIKGDWRIKCQVLREAAPRSYIVVAESGKMYRRNRRHLLLTKELFKRQNESDYEDDIDMPIPHINVPNRPVIANQVNNPPPINIRRSTRDKRRPDRLIEQD